MPCPGFWRPRPVLCNLSSSSSSFSGPTGPFFFFFSSWLRECLVFHSRISSLSTSFLFSSSDSHLSTRCSPDCSWWPHWHSDVSLFFILCSHFRCGPFSVTHQVYADIAFRCHPSIPAPLPPLASA